MCGKKNISINQRIFFKFTKFKYIFSFYLNYSNIYENNYFYEIMNLIAQEFSWNIFLHFNPSS